MVILGRNVVKLKKKKKTPWVFDFFFKNLMSIECRSCKTTKSHFYIMDQKFEASFYIFEFPG
jgi:hypothetical protein